MLSVVQNEVSSDMWHRSKFRVVQNMRAFISCQKCAITGKPDHIEYKTVYEVEKLFFHSYALHQIITHVREAQSFLQNSHVTLSVPLALCYK